VLPIDPSISAPYFAIPYIGIIYQNMECVNTISQGEEICQGRSFPEEEKKGREASSLPFSLVKNDCVPLYR
jgi:hypothetical protein